MTGSPTQYTAPHCIQVEQQKRSEALFDDFL
jgi:hypothetical protein